LDEELAMKAQNIASEQELKNGRAKTADSERRTVSVEEAGRILGISRGSAYGLAKSGELPTIRLGKRVLVPKAALERMLAG
jgi:excisionase family DNA binding protein